MNEPRQRRPRSLPSVPHTEAAKRRISESMRGHVVSEATRAKMRASHLGKRHTPEAIEKIRAARRAREKTTEQVLEECRAAVQERRRAEARLRWGQRTLDRLKALRLGLPELAKDIQQSYGWWVKRKMHHPEVSDGYSKRHRKIMHYPYLRRLRCPTSADTQTVPAPSTSSTEPTPKDLS